jgi:serine/threonine protein kinase
MKYPSRSEYCSAIRNPQFAFRKKDPQTKIERDLDASLVAGKAVERIKPDGTKDIWSAAGSFAIAFKFETSSPRKLWAVRCFYRSNFEVKNHYKQALTRLKNSSCRNYFVDSTFLEAGIRVQGDCYPILKMEWVEGENLKKFIKANLGKRNVLLSLAERWRELCKNLYDAGIAHGDLQHGNVLVVKSFQQFSLKLIDYDSLYFSEDRHSVDDNIKGLSDYQHPLRKSLEKRCLEIDFFPQLAIYLSILALAEDKKLWEVYQLDAREGLLFSRSDFQNPDTGDIFKYLAQFCDPIPELTRKMKQICRFKEFKNIPSLETVLSTEQWVESHHKNSVERHSSSSQLLNSIVSWLKERSPQPTPLCSTEDTSARKWLPLKRGAMRECTEVAQVSVLATNLEQEAMRESAEVERVSVVATNLTSDSVRECPEVQGEDSLEPVVKITALSSEIQPVQPLAASPKKIGGWDPRSLKSDYTKYIKPVSSIHNTSTKISSIPTQFGTLVKQKTEKLLNWLNSTKDNFLKACHSLLRNLGLQLQNLKSTIVQAIAPIFNRLKQINRVQIPTNPIIHQPKIIDKRNGGQEESKISDLSYVTTASTELANPSVPKIDCAQTSVQLQPSQPKTQTTAQVAAQLGCSLSWCHAQRYQHPDRFLADIHYYKDTAGIVHWMEAGIEQLCCLKSEKSLKSQKKLSDIPANSLPTKEVSRRLGVSPEWLTKTKAKHASDFAIDIHYHTDARKRYYWTPTGIQLLQKLLDEQKPLVVDGY